MDQSVVSADAVNLSKQQESRITNITSMQEQIRSLDLVQNALEDISGNLWALDKQVTAAGGKQQQRSVQNQETEEVADTISATAAEDSAEQQELQQTTNSYLEGIDHTGSELMDFLQKFRESYSLDMDINTASLGRIDEESSLASLREDIPLSSAKAGDIVAKAQEEVASFRVSTEMHRNNLLNDIGKELTGFTEEELVNPDTTNELNSTIQRATDMLLHNPAAIANISERINPSKAATLLLS